MKRLLAFILVFALMLCECIQPGLSEETSAVQPFSGLDDPALLQYVQDQVYSDLEYRLASDDFVIEDVSAIYISKEYLEEVAYNSQANIFFGYTLAELDEQFQGKRYVFTLGSEGETTVQEFAGYDDTYDKVIKNVAIGTGIILVCVTVSVMTGGAASAPISVIFAASAKTGATFALSSGVFSGVTAGVLTGSKTEDFDQAIKAAALNGSEGFKWGAISGALTGGLSKINALQKASSAVPNFHEAEEQARKHYGGSKQVAFLERKEVDPFTPGSTRPDIVRWVKNHWEAIEVKRYDLSNSNCLSELKHVLKKQIADRVANLPEGSTQRICLNVQGRGYSEELVSNAVAAIRAHLQPVYPDIPIDVMW